MTTNRLKLSSSPYLLQHANDPVHWHPWDNEALEKARAENKPILLSIGYSACHWCHVMAHESFENEQIASTMNEHFVNIKLDREERPDLDKIYQMTHQLLLQQPGGWPLTVFLTPDQHIPFFAGTYFPPEAKNGMPGFKDLVLKISEYFTKEGEMIQAQGEEIKKFFDSFDERELKPQLDAIPIAKAISLLQADFDPQHGGFGGTPKFPFPTTLDFFLRQWVKTAYDDKPDRQLLFMVSQTLQQMARGGLYDQVRGGFFRYSTDEAWMIPHFEKMLSDNAQLIPLYASMYQISGDIFYYDAAIESIKWLIDDMQSDNEAFYSTLNADSEGVEGKYYVWSKDEVESLLDIDELNLATQHFNLKEDANFAGKYHLHQIADTAALAEQQNAPRTDIKHRLDTIKKILLDNREQRVSPSRDDKMLTSWNALTAKALITAGRSLGDENIQEKGKKLLLKLQQEWQSNSKQFFVQIGKHSHPKLAFLDEYAFSLDAIIEELQSEWNIELLDWAIEIADTLLSDFNSDKGGFYYTNQKDPEKLLYRPLTFTDDALPSGNAIAIRSLLRLGALLENNDYLKSAEKALQSSYLEMDKSPQAHASLLSVLDEYLEPGKQIIIRGEQQAIDEWRKSLQSLYAPKIQIYAIANDHKDLPSVLNAKIIREITVAYVCAGSHCSEPIYNLQQLIDTLT